MFGADKKRATNLGQDSLLIHRIRKETNYLEKTQHTPRKETSFAYPAFLRENCFLFCFKLIACKTSSSYLRVYFLGIAQRYIFLVFTQIALHSFYAPDDNGEYHEILHWPTYADNDLFLIDSLLWRY